jgi:hypothetical protein
MTQVRRHHLPRLRALAAPVLRHRPVALGLAAALAGGCQGMVPERTPTPEPTVVVANLPTDTAAPPPTDVLPPGTPDLIATVIAMATNEAAGIGPSAPTLGPVMAGIDRGPTPGCEIPRRPETWRLAPAPDAPEPERLGWSSFPAHTGTVEVVEHRPAEQLYVLRPIEPPASYLLHLSYDGAPLPLAPGQPYRITAWQDGLGMPPSGLALKVEDEAGPVFLGISLREVEGANDRVLPGDRAGFSVQQLPTQCLYTETDTCGVELRAAPVEVGRGGGAVTLGPGKQSVIPGTPAYRVTVLTSHLRRPLAVAPCADPTDWVLSYRIERLPATE